MKTIKECEEAISAIGTHVEELEDVIKSQNTAIVVINSQICLLREYIDEQLDTDKIIAKLRGAGVMLRL